jgi:uncharacterized pyridoxal phosphate-containing UPF0001 family protein
VDALSAAVMNSERADRELGCLVQVALDVEEAPGRHENGEAGARGGVAPHAVEGITEAIAAAPGLRLDGVMTVAPLAGRYAGRPRDAFDRLMEVSYRLRTRLQAWSPQG